MGRLVLMPGGVCASRRFVAEKVILCVVALPAGIRGAAPVAAVRAKDDYVPNGRFRGLRRRMSPRRPTLPSSNVAVPGSGTTASRMMSLKLPAPV